MAATYSGSSTAAISNPFSNSSAALFAQDLLLAFPRLAQRAGFFAVNYLPEQLDGLFSLAKGPGSAIADATSTTITSNASLLPPGTAAATAAASNSTASASASGFFSMGSAITMPDLSKVDGFFTYIASRWALSTAVMAIILNRAYVYAYSRRALRFNWKTRFVVRIIPILLFTYQIHSLLQAIRCQTGDYIRTAGFEASKGVLNAHSTADAPNMQWVSSKLLFWQTEEQSCQAVGMIPDINGRPWAIGSASLLWPLFLSFCLSHFLETISCALRSQIPVAETGMTIFEHSLAFAEAEAGIRTSVGLTMFGFPKSAVQTSTSSASPAPTSTADGAEVIALTRSLVTQRLNAPPEMLLISLVSAANHLSSHVLGLFGLQARFRLLNTSVWGICYMGVFLKSFIDAFKFASGETSGFPRLPTVCMIGFIPHLMIISGVLICAYIYGFALLLTLLSPHEHYQGRPISFRERLKVAHGNLQANIFLTNIRINWNDEFYTFLLKLGWTMMTAASEAVYFNEGTSITVKPRTWLDEKRFQEASEQFNGHKAATDRFRSQIPAELRSSFDLPGEIGLVDEEEPLTSGFARERKTTKKDGKAVTYSRSEEGVGGSQRTARVYLAFRFLKSCFELITWFVALSIVKSSRMLGLRSQPRWLIRLAKSNRRKRATVKQSATAKSGRYLDFWMLSDEGTLHLPKDRNVDVEVETRQRLQQCDDRHDRSEAALDAHLYGWWKQGGWWGDIDSSGDYMPEVDADNDDMTSVISDSTNASRDDGDDNDMHASNVSDFGTNDESGRRTPTPSNPFPHFSASLPASREATPFEDSSLSHLSRLLDPKTLEDKQEAKLLSQHFRKSTGGPLTRSQYSRIVRRDQLRILQPSSTYNNLCRATLTPEEEEILLEQIILSRRGNAGSGAASRSNDGMPAWTQGAEGMGSDGPQCVVCQSSPRTILVWPCRCLSLCEECRVSLAMNNFGNCVCCRRDVVAFSRLYVP